MNFSKIIIPVLLITSSLTYQAPCFGSNKIVSGGAAVEIDDQTEEDVVEVSVEIQEIGPIVFSANYDRVEVVSDNGKLEFRMYPDGIMEIYAPKMSVGGMKMCKVKTKTELATYKLKENLLKIFIPKV